MLTGEENGGLLDQTQNPRKTYRIMWGNCQSYPELYTGYIWFKKGNKQDYSDSVAVPKLRQQVVSVGQLST